MCSISTIIVTVIVKLKLAICTQYTFNQSQWVMQSKKKQHGQQWLFHLQSWKGMGPKKIHMHSLPANFRPSPPPHPPPNREDFLTTIMLAAPIFCMRDPPPRPGKI